MNATDSCITVCNRLLRSELSAVDTYTQAVVAFPDEQWSLAKIRTDHLDSAEILREHISRMGGIPDKDSGVWSGFSEAVQDTATLLGESTALRALIDGEEHGISGYGEVLANPDVLGEIKSSISGSLLPRLDDHVAVLRLIARP